MNIFQPFKTSPAMNIQRIIIIGALLCAAAQFSGCSDSSNDDETPDTTDTLDTADVGDVDEDGDDGGADFSDANNAVDELGKPCSDDDDCLSDFCVQFASANEGFCSIRCLANNDDCPSASETSQGVAFNCESLPITGDDLEFACVGEDFCYDPDEDQYGFGQGCPRIGFDCDQTNASINPGAPEECDVIDHNCNGFIADAVVFAAGSQTCIVDENVSVCRSGRRICNAITDGSGTEIDVEEVCIANIEPGSQVERCNGIDDDCDGVADDVDLDIQSVGQACSTGINDCVDGTIICDLANTQLICESSGTGVGGAEPDVCDGRDNNCDDVVDENFKNDDGIYDRLEHCGACNVNCNEQLPGDPDDLNVTASCDIQAGFASCGFACRPGFVNADGFDENGCEFAPDEEAVYVARADDGGSDGGGCGTYDSPCATIATGISRAQGQSKVRVLVGSGAFPEPIDLADGVSVLGGHDPRTWTRNTDIFVTSVSGGMEVNNDFAAVYAENISNPTELSGFTVVPSPAFDGRNSVGVLVRNSNQNLEIRNNNVFAARGGDGQSGASGTSGAAGTNGSTGLPSLWIGDTSGNCGPDDRAGGAAGTNSCGGQNVSGGNGGDADNCVDESTNRGNAPSGNGASPGSGGVNSTDVDADLGSLTCNDPDNNRNSTDGENGGNGSDGAGGDGASNSAGQVNTSWSGISGESGNDGNSGSGGGGGGAAINIENESGSNKDLYLAATGGGGGAGGCAGTSGAGGTAGGGSFAIFISGGSAPVIENNLLARDAGGSGGSGGNGGAGGSPGTGGDGGPRDVSGAGPSLICVEPARPGGDGGRGGHGGGGGGGAGGISFDIALAGVSGSQDYATTNDFNIDGSVETGGSGGAGGSSPNNAGSPGAIGDAGVVATF